MSELKHYSDADGLRLLSYNGILNEVLSNRTYGKTWTFKKRAFKRALRKGKKTIWLRLFKKEAQNACASFFSSSDLRKYCGVSIYDKQSNPHGNLKKDGNTFYYRRSDGDPWKWFLKVYALSDADAVRSVDDVQVDTIIFDEFAKPANKYKQYRGRLVDDFIDILFSSKREHAVKCFLLGNKEQALNPFNSYFGITPPRADFEGIRTYRKGSFVLQQINNQQKNNTDYDAKLNALLDGTAYGNYIYNNEYHATTRAKLRKMPATASLYVQLYIKTYPLKIASYNGFFYVNGRVDKTKSVYCDACNGKFNKEFQLVRRHKRLFWALENAIAENRVFCDGVATAEAFDLFKAWLNV